LTSFSATGFFRDEKWPAKTTAGKLFLSVFAWSTSAQRIDSIWGRYSSLPNFSTNQLRGCLLPVNVFLFLKYVIGRSRWVPAAIVLSFIGEEDCAGLAVHGELSLQPGNGDHSGFDCVPDAFCLQVRGGNFLFDTRDSLAEGQRRFGRWRVNAVGALAYNCALISSGGKSHSRSFNEREDFRLVEEDDSLVELKSRNLAVVSPAKNSLRANAETGS